MMRNLTAAALAALIAAATPALAEPLEVAAAMRAARAAAVRLRIMKRQSPYILG